MSKRNKLTKFSDLSQMPFVFQCFSYKDAALINSADEEVNFQGQWAEKVFKNSNPIVLEVACGRGEYSLALAERYPEKNFIGVDIKGARLWKGGKNAIAANLKNIAFLRSRVELLEKFFGQHELAEIWITFPDPFLKSSKSNRRLTAPRFLNIYKHILQKEGICHLKTDNEELYNFSLEVFEEEKIHVLYHDDDIYSKALYHDDLDVKTYYEKEHLANGLTIKYIQFQVN